MSLPNTLDIPYWVQRWENNQAQWHLPKVNTGMTNNLDKWIGDAKDGRVFFPLCGKTLDMTFMATAGFTVIGSEGSYLLKRAISRCCFSSFATIISSGCFNYSMFFVFLLFFSLL